MIQYNRTGLEKLKSKKDEIKIRNIRHKDFIKIGVIVLCFVVFVLSIAE